MKEFKNELMKNNVDMVNMKKRQRYRNILRGVETVKVTDLVCKMTIEDKDAAATSTFKGTTYYFCSEAPAKKILIKTLNLMSEK